MNLGKVIATGTPGGGAQRHPDVVRSYLGVDSETSAAVHARVPGDDETQSLPQPNRRVTQT